MKGRCVCVNRILSVIFAFVLVLSLGSCDFDINSSLDTPKVYSEVDDMALLDFLNENISKNNTVDEIIDVFEEMCRISIEDELLLLEYGVYDFTGEELFYFDLVRQYPDGDGEYYQLRVSLMFTPDKENSKLNDTLWSDDVDENFFDYIRKSSGYMYAKNNSIKSIDIRIDRT